MQAAPAERACSGEEPRSHQVLVLGETAWVST